VESTIETNGGSAPQASRNKVGALDLLVALGGVAVLVGLAFEWSGGSGASGYEGISVLRVFLVLVGLAGVALPVVLASTRKSDVPVIWEATLAPVASIFLVIVAVEVWESGCWSRRPACWSSRSPVGTLCPGNPEIRSTWSHLVSRA
jgi:hypothetical protein